MADTNGAGRPHAATSYRVELGGQAVTVEVTERDDGLYVRVGDGLARHAEVAAARHDGELSLLLDGVLLSGLVGAHEGGVTVAVDGLEVQVTFPSGPLAGEISGWKALKVGAKGKK